MQISKDIVCKQKRGNTLKKSFSQNQIFVEVWKRNFSFEIRKKVSLQIFQLIFFSLHPWQRFSFLKKIFHLKIKFVVFLCSVQEQKKEKRFLSSLLGGVCSVKSWVDNLLVHGNLKGNLKLLKETRVEIFRGNIFEIKWGGNFQSFWRSFIELNNDFLENFQCRISWIYFKMIFNISIMIFPFFIQLIS